MRPLLNSALWSSCLIQHFPDGIISGPQGSFDITWHSCLSWLQGSVTGIYSLSFFKCKSCIGHQDEGGPWERKWSTHSEMLWSVFGNPVHLWWWRPLHVNDQPCYIYKLKKMLVKNWLGLELGRTFLGVQLVHSWWILHGSVLYSL